MAAEEDCENCLARSEKEAPARNCPTMPSAAARTSLSPRRVVQRQEDFRDDIFAGADGGTAFRQPRLDFIDADFDARRNPSAHHLAPGGFHPQSFLQRLDIEPVAPEKLRQPARLHIVAVLDVRDLPRDFVLAHADAEPLRFLALQALVHEVAQDLRSKAAAEVRAILDIRRRQRDSQPGGNIVPGNDVVVDDRHDSAALLSLRRADGSKAAQEKSKPQTCTTHLRRSQLVLLPLLCR